LARILRLYHFETNLRCLMQVFKKRV